MNVSTFLDWLIHSTCQASLLICLILGLQWALRRWIDVRTRYLLWLLVIVRLALPWAPQSRLSLYNLLPETPRKGYEAIMGPEAGVGPTYLAERDEIYAARPLASSGSVAYDSTQRAQAPLDRGSAERIRVYLALFWLAGAAALGMYALVSNLHIWHRVRRMRPVTDPEILALLDDCRQQMGVRSPVTVMVTEQINGPALFGVLWPRLLLPSRALAELEHRELRYVLLHELAHLRRHDILVSILTCALQVLHWFNPLVSYGLLRMRADRELVCDGLALSQLGPHEASAYGHTVIRLIEQLTLPRRSLLVGFLGDRALIKQRVAMISLFRRETFRWSPLALLLVGLVGCIGLTNGHAVDQAAQAERAAIQPTELHDSPETPAPAYANTKRIYIRHRQQDQYLIADGPTVAYAAEPGDAGLWEARYDGEFTPNGAMLIYSVSQGMYLSTDAQGNLAITQSRPDLWARWTRQAGPLGVQVISQGMKGGYLCLHEQGQINLAFVRGPRSQWDIMQLDRVTETKQIANK